MRRKLGFAVTLAAAAAFQAGLAQSATALPNPWCSMPVETVCQNYQSLGFASYVDCETYYTQYCAAIAAGGGCYYDPREGYVICF